MMRVVVLVCIALALSSCGGAGRTRQPQRSAEPVDVVYRVGGNAEASLTYRNATGGTEQRSVTPPWALPFQARRGAFLYVAAQTTGSGTAVCAILVGGKVVAEATATGGYRIATCQGRAE